MRLTLSILFFSFFIKSIVSAAPVEIKNSLPDDSPRLFILKADLLAKAKQEIQQNNGALLPAANTLRTLAEKAISGPLYSVINKQFVPLSGDKHDYLSMGTYWWPNPQTADGLPYVRRDGEANPEIKLLKNDKDLDNMIKGVENTALAYYFFQDERYAAKATQLLRTWFLDEETRMNSNLNYGQAVPGVSDGRGIGIIDTHKFPFLLDAVGLLQGSASWTEKDQQGLENWFKDYLTWLLESKNGRDAAKEKNNHGTWYDAQTAAIALFVNKNSLAEDILQKALTKRLVTQIKPDGSQPHELSRTLSWTYSVMNLNAFFTLASLADNVGLDYWHYQTADGRSIRQALDYLLPFASGERGWEAKQIKVLDTGFLYPVLRQATVIYTDATYGQVATRLADKKLLSHKANLFWPALK